MLLVFVDIIVVSIDVEQPKQFVERLMLGKFNSTWGDLRTKQFKGSVSNIQVFTNFNSFIEALFTYSLDYRFMRESIVWKTSPHVRVTLRAR